MADIDYGKLAEAIAKGNKTNTSATPSANPFAKVAADVTAGFNPFTAAIGFAGKAVGGLKDGIDYLQTSVKENLDTFRTLSKTGASFSNDVVGMTVASKNMRLDLGEFSEIMQKNSANFAGLGGNVTRGAEQFAKLSKGLMESPFIDSLRQAGYTNKELNEVLALQVGFIRTSMSDSKERDAEAIQSAERLAKEMDSMAKLTGKSREEQMDNMKKAQADMQVEAKMRLIGIKEGPEAEAKARTLYAEQYNAAQLRGQGQMFKEVFATGQVMSKEAATQSALSGKEGLETIKAANATAKGNAEGARAASQQAQVEAVKNGQNVARLNLAITGDMTTAGKAITDSMTANRGLNDSIMALRKENDAAVASGKARKLSEEELMVEAKKRVEAAAAGRDAEGKKVSGATDAMINLGSRAKDVEAALTDSLLTPLNKQIGPGLGRFSERYLGSQVEGTGKNLAQSIRDTADEGRQQAQKDDRGDRRTRGGDPIDNQPDKYFQESTVRGVSRIANTGIKGLSQGLNQINQAPVSRLGGSIGETGQLFENFGQGTLAMLHGKETVMTEEQFKNMAKGAQLEGIKNQAMEYSKSSSLNLDKMKKDVISFSSSAGKENTMSANKSTSTGSTGQKIDMSSMKYDQFGMPVTKDIKYKTDELTQETKKKEEEAKKETAKKEDTAKATTPATSTAPAAQAKPAASSGKESSLSDVVASLNQLNSKVSQLIDVQKDVGMRQIKATKSNSSDIYQRS